MKTSSKPSLPVFLRWAGRMDAHHRFIVACALAAVVFLGLQGRADLTTQTVAAWNVFALVIVALAWMAMSTKDPYEVRRNAGAQDASQKVLFVVVVAAAAVSLIAVFALLGASKNLSHDRFALNIGLAAAAISLSWTLVHTLFSVRYAHLYYIDAHKLDRDEIEGGLVFPGDENPDYFDFAYFSFVIGMTCQVSDVQISSKIIRRLATIHGVISFAFNTAILAVFVNLAASFIS